MGTIDINKCSWLGFSYGFVEKSESNVKYVAIHFYFASPSLWRQIVKIIVTSLYRSDLLKLQASNFALDFTGIALATYCLAGNYNRKSQTNMLFH